MTGNRLQETPQIIPRIIGLDALRWLRFVKHHGFEAVTRMEAEILIEIYRWVVGFGDSQSDCLEAGPFEVAHAMLQKRPSQMSPAQLFRDAKLGDVGDIFSYTGAQDDAHQGSPAGLAEHPGVRGIEDSAAGKANDVMQEAERAVQ